MQQSQPRNVSNSVHNKLFLTFVSDKLTTELFSPPIDIGRKLAQNSDPDVVWTELKVLVHIVSLDNCSNKSCVGGVNVDAVISAAVND